MHPARILVAAALLSSFSLAQTTHTVGGSGHATVDDALSAAAPGDEIVVLDGSYPGFSMNLPVTIRAQNPGNVQFTSMSSASAIPSGHLVGLGFTTLSITDATLTVEDCVIASTGSAFTMTVTDSIATLERCTVQAQPIFAAFGGLNTIRRSVVSMTDCTFTGTTASLSVSPRTIEVRDQSTLIASGVTVQGGVPSDPAPALLIDPNCTAHFVDSSLLSAPGQCAIVGTNFSSSVFCDRCTIDASCPTLAGPPQLGVTTSGALVRGQSYTATFRGEANQLLLVFGSDDLDVLATAQLHTPFLLAAAGCFPAAAATTDANGVATLSWQLPTVTLPPGVGVWLQGVCGAGLPLAASPAVGGLVR
ncbi:MAG: hypothetical protein KAI24_09465 [Planctomycetes bacterium]|nr:hypothetical protein [Planctomycetota bacterium]